MATEKTYDYIVIGGGSSGCVVAGRLSEAGYNVLLLEAGGRDNSPWIHIPLGYSKLYANPKVNWNYTSEPETALGGRRLFQPRGKVIGGTSSINGMIYMRGQAENFDEWEAQGCKGWGWKDVLPYFKKCEDQERGADEYHGVDGPIAVSDLPSKHALGEAYHQSSMNLGSQYNKDFNGKTQFGTGYVQTTTRNLKRCSTAKGYLQGKVLENIHMVLHAMVEHIIIKDKKASGVVWRDKHGQNRAQASKEVILCAGVFNSPQILELSGIGAKERLEKHNIAPIHELKAVGENLQDHFGVGLECRSKLKTTVNDLYNNPLRGGLQLLRYFLFKKGPFADNGNYSNTFISTTNDEKNPDMMITFMAWCTTEELKPHPFSGFTILSEHIKPQSLGSVHISSKNPEAAPVIHFNFLQSENDKKAIVAGLKYARKIAQTPPLSDCILEEIAPGAHVQSDEDLLEYCRKDGKSLLHAVGTCRMGVGEDAVVDPRLRVHGIENLRVVDASIMPKIVSANTNAACIMIGEKGAEMIIEDAKS